MKLLRSELASEFNHKLFDMSAKGLPDRGMVFAEDQIHCELSAHIVQFGFQVSGEIKAKPVYECVRCLGKNPVDLSLPMKVWLTAREEISTNDQDVIHFPEPQDQIDLSATVADIISLAGPLNPICKEGCKGLCPQCGTNLNLVSCDCEPEKDDSPWDVLKKIKPE